MYSYLQSAVTNSVAAGYSHFYRGPAGGHASEFAPAVPLSRHSVPSSNPSNNSSTNPLTDQSIVPSNDPGPGPINEFNLSDFGIDLDALLEQIGPTFDSLPLDIYEKRRQEVLFLKNRFPDHGAALSAFFFDYMSSKARLSDLSNIISTLSGAEVFALEHTGDVRHRSIAKFDVSFNEENHNDLKSIVKMERVPAAGFVQMTSKSADFRALPRYFAEASEQVTSNNSVQKLLRSVVTKVKEQRHAPVHRLELTLHQVIVSVDAETPFILPDGIHQDGSDFIVSAIPIIMNNVIAPVSTIYDANLHPILETQLGIGQGLLHDDRTYWHGVSTLCSSGTAGKRGTLGLDVQLKN
jgi:hypothetical protein